MFRLNRKTGLIEIEACTWGALENDWLPFPAWPEEVVMPAAQFVILVNAAVVGGTAVTGPEASRLVMSTGGEIDGFLEVWIQPHARSLTTREGWVASGLDWAS